MNFKEKKLAFFVKQPLEACHFYCTDCKDFILVESKVKSLDAYKLGKP